MPPPPIRYAALFRALLIRVIALLYRRCYARRAGQNRGRPQPAPLFCAFFHDAAFRRGADDAVAAAVAADVRLFLIELLAAAFVFIIFLLPLRLRLLRHFRRGVGRSAQPSPEYNVRQQWVYVG